MPEDLQCPTSDKTSHICSVIGFWDYRRAIWVPKKNQLGVDYHLAGGGRGEWIHERFFVIILHVTVICTRSPLSLSAVNESFFTMQL